MSELAALNPIEDTVEGMIKKIRAASYAFKALKDDDLRDPVRSNWKLEKYMPFCKALPICYSLTFNWSKIVCPCSSVMIGWSSRHNLLSNLYINCSENATFSKLSIRNHTRTRKEDPTHFTIKSYLEALNGINDLEESTCT